MERVFAHGVKASNLQTFIMSRIEDYFPKVSECMDTAHRKCQSIKPLLPFAKASISTKRRPIVQKGKRPVGRPRKNKQPKVSDLTIEGSRPPAKQLHKGDITDSSESEESESKSS